MSTNRCQNIRTWVVLLCATGIGSSQSALIDVTAPRPVYEAILQLQRLSPIPVHYEDLQYVFARDFHNVAASVLTPQQWAANPQARMIIPIGGRLSATIAVDTASGKLPNSFATSNALSSILAAQRIESVPGRFRLETGQSSLFVEPEQQRSASGSLVAARPILQTPVTLNATEAPAFKVLEDILRQVKAGSGVTVNVGMIPANGFAMTRVTLAASSEPAKYTLDKLLRIVFGPRRSASYQMLYDPGKQEFVLNVAIPAPAALSILPDYTKPLPVNPTRLGKPQIL